MNAVFSDLCFPFPKFQVGRVAFDGTITFSYLTLFTVQNRVSVFWKAALFVFYSQNPEIALS